MNIRLTVYAITASSAFLAVLLSLPWIGWWNAAVVWTVLLWLAWRSSPTPGTLNVRWEDNSWVPRR